MVKPKSVGDIMTARSFFNTHGAHLLEAILNIKSKKNSELENTTTVLRQLSSLPV